MFRVSTDKKSFNACRSKTTKHATISEANRGHDSHRKKTAVAILPRHIFISSLIMKPIHCAHNGLPEWMNAAVLFMTQYPFRAGKIEQRGKKCRTQVTISAPVSEVTLLFGAFSLSLSLSVYSAKSLSSFALLLCLPTRGVSWIPHSRLTGWQPVAVCVCSSYERKWLRAKHCHVRTAVDILMKHGL